MLHHVYFISQFKCIFCKYIDRGDIMVWVGLSEKINLRNSEKKWSENPAIQGPLLSLITTPAPALFQDRSIRTQSESPRRRGSFGRGHCSACSLSDQILSCLAPNSLQHNSYRHCWYSYQGRSFGTSPASNYVKGHKERHPSNVGRMAHFTGWEFDHTTF